MSQKWLYLILTCLFELIWVTGFNLATTWYHWLVVSLVIVVDFHFLFKACQYLPTGTVYAIFSAAGTIGTAIIDTFLFNAIFTNAKIFFMLILIIGVINLKLADNNVKEGVE